MWNCGAQHRRRLRAQCSTKFWRIFIWTRPCQSCGRHCKCLNKSQTLVQSARAWDSILACEACIDKRGSEPTACQECTKARFGFLWMTLIHRLVRRMSLEPGARGTETFVASRRVSALRLPSRSQTPPLQEFTSWPFQVGAFKDATVGKRRALDWAPGHEALA